MSIATLVTFILYLLGMLGIGLWAFYRTKNLSDYVLGGRQLGSLVTALSASASDMSGWLLLGLPGALYFSGLSEMWICLGLALGAYYNWKVTAPRLRVYTEVASNSITLPDYFSNRFEDKANLLRVTSATVILIFFTVYVASGLTAGAKLFEASFAMDYQVALWLGAVVIVSYTFFGGFLAVSWTDVVQGLLMVTALVIAPITIVMTLGGIEQISTAIQYADQSILNSCQSSLTQTQFWSQVTDFQSSSVDVQNTMKASYDSLCKGLSENSALRSDWFGGQTAWQYFFSISFFSLMAWGLGYYGQPHLLARFMAAKNVKEVHKARRIAMSWMIVSMLGAVTVGYFAIAYFAKDAQGVNLLFNKETVFIVITQLIFNEWIAGFLLAAILAAVMSTIDSQLLVSSSSVTEDFYKTFFRKSASETELVWVGRFSVLIIAIIAIIIASDPTSSVLSLVSNAWAGFGAAFGPVIVLSLLWRKMTFQGALAGMFFGAITVIIWVSTKDAIGGWVAETYEMIPGVIVAITAIVIGSRFGTVSESMSSQFNEVRTRLQSGV